MWFFNTKKNIDYKNLVAILEIGDEAAIQQLLWQPKHKQLDYLPVTTEMLQNLMKPNSSNHELSIHKTIETKKYELIIFSTPWVNSDLPFSPLILEKTTGKVVGVMLLFNELYHHFSKKDNSAISDLGVNWILFTLDQRAQNSNSQDA
jgi:hypothetical protein